MSVAELYRRLLVSFGSDIEITAGKSSTENVILWMTIVEDKSSAENVGMYSVVLYNGMSQNKYNINDMAELISRNGASALIVSGDGYDIGESDFLRSFCDGHSLPLIEIRNSGYVCMLMNKLHEAIKCFYESERNFERLLYRVIGDHKLYGCYSQILERNGFFDHSHYCAGVYLFKPKCGDFIDENAVNCAARYVEIGISKIASAAAVFEIGKELAAIIPDAEFEVFISAIESGLNEIPDELKEMFEIYVGFSYFGEGIESVLSLIRYAEKSVLLKKCSGNNSNKVSTSECGLNRFIIWLSDHADVDFAVNESIGKLKDYDRINGTNYVNLLKVYFKTNCSLQKAANELYIHKNSVCYAIHKIEHILGRHLSDLSTRAELLLMLGLSELFDAERN